MRISDWSSDVCSSDLEQWGAVFDRTADGRILQRPFGGHSHPRLAHVGDRTGLELIRTLQDRAVAAGIDVYLECTITRLVTSRDQKSVVQGKRVYVGGDLGGAGDLKKNKKRAHK